MNNDWITYHWSWTLFFKFFKLIRLIFSFWMGKIVHDCFYDLCYLRSAFPKVLCKLDTTPNSTSIVDWDRSFSHPIPVAQCVFMVVSFLRGCSRSRPTHRNQRRYYANPKGWTMDLSPPLSLNPGTRAHNRLMLIPKEASKGFRHWNSSPQHLQILASMGLLLRKAAATISSLCLSLSYLDARWRWPETDSDTTSAPDLGRGQLEA